ncbi:putative gibberellin regulated protein [Helianthus annuus]|nr:putative gibberellin regulated protein [Helianthus annuus]
MAMKLPLFLLASFLLLTTSVTSNEQEAAYVATTPAPSKTPPPPPQVKPPPVAKPPTPTPPECYPPCLERCKLHSRQNVCLRACVTCCDRCKCVPPGQSGNREVCGTCYTNMKTHGGRPKCP